MPNTLTVTSLADAGAGTLRAAIAQASAGDTIEFAADLAGQTILLTSGQIDIAAGKTLTIDGSNAPNLTISGNAVSRIFHLNSTSATPSQLVIKHLILANGYTPDRGGAISTTHQGQLTVDNVTFLNNVADNGGGAIFSAFEGTLTVTHSSFQGNKAIAGNDERGAGAIAFWGPRNITIQHSDFINNEGINGGAINSLNGNLKIEQSRFINNRTTAATYDSGNQNPFLRGYGGAIYTDRASTSSDATSGAVRIVGSLFQGNQGRGEGGAAYLYAGTQDYVVIDSSTFIDNAIQDLPQGNAGNGGGVVVMSNGLNLGLTINRSTFANNTSSNQGGGLWMMDAPTTITNSTFSGNRVTGTASNKIGGGMALYGPTTIVNTTIANNHAGWVGGGVSASSNDSVTLKNTIFYNNTADNGTNAWGIQQHTNRELIDQGGNLQWPPKQTSNWNDYNATANIQLSDPQLEPLQDNGSGLLTHTLRSGSPAINAGIQAGSPVMDQWGATRDSAPDSGAVEFGAEVPDPGGELGLVSTDFNSDRLTDIVWRNQITGEIGIWLMNQAGNARLQAAVPNPQFEMNTNWEIQGVGDLTGDGQADFIWRNQATGENAVWQMNGVSRGLSSAFLPSESDTRWDIQGTGDFNGDGKTDLFWRNQATGENAIWYMNDTVKIGGSFVRAETDLNWQVGGVGDCDGDGQVDDLVWRNQATGENVVWVLEPDPTNGSQLRPAARSWFLTTETDLNWVIQGVSDLNNDGQHDDILWRRDVTGQNATWFNLAKGGAFLPDVPSASGWSSIV